MTTSTGLNHDLAKEILRIKDALFMYPDDRPKKRKYLTVTQGEIPTDKPETVTEWLSQVVLNREKPQNLTEEKLTPKTETEFQRQKLTAEQKVFLKSISFNSQKQE